MEPFQEEYVSTRTPGYPAIILALGQSRVAVMGLQVAISLTTIWLCLLFLKKFSNSALAHNVLLIGFLFNPSQILYSTTLMTEIPFQLFLISVFLSIILYIKTSKVQWIYISALALCIGFIIKPVLYPFSLIFMAVGIIYFVRKKNFIHIPITIVPLLVVLVFASWNYTRTGAFEVSSIQTTNFLNFNAKMVLYQAEGVERGDFVIGSLEQEANLIKNFPQRQKFRSEETRKIFLAHPFVAAFQYIKGCGAFLLDPGRYDWVTYWGIDNQNGFMFATGDSKADTIQGTVKSTPIAIWLILLIVFLFNIVELIFYGIFILKHPQLNYVKIILSVGILYILAVTGSLGVSRYALPIEPLLLIGVSLGATRFINQSSNIN